MPAMKEQPHAQEDGEGLLEPPSQIYSLHLWHRAVYSFALAKNCYPNYFLFLQTALSVPNSGSFPAESPAQHSEQLHSQSSVFPAVFFLSTAGKMNVFTLHLSSTQPSRALLHHSQLTLREQKSRAKPDPRSQLPPTPPRQPKKAKLLPFLPYYTLSPPDRVLTST